MKELIILLVFILLIVLIGVSFNTIRAIYAIARFEKYELYNDERLYAFARDVMSEMGLINYRIHIAINRKKKNPNADIGIHNKDIFIVLHGKWNDEHLKFVVSHELAHIKFGHQREDDSRFFAFSLLLMCAFIFNVIKYVYPTIFENKYGSLVECILSCLWVIIFVIIYYISDVIFKERSQKNEKDADLLAAMIVGKRIAIDAISMLNDKSLFKSTHPSNKDRIQYLECNLKC